MWITLVLAGAIVATPPGFHRDKHSVWWHAKPHLILRSLDYGLSELALRRHPETEANPLIPRSRSGRIALAASTIAALTAIDYAVYRSPSAHRWFRRGAISIQVGALTLGLTVTLEF